MRETCKESIHVSHVNRNEFHARSNRRNNQANKWRTSFHSPSKGSLVLVPIGRTGHCKKSVVAHRAFYLQQVRR